MQRLAGESTDAVYFGPFVLWSAQRRLERNDVVVPLGSRALDILIVLVRNAGKVVGKRELMAAAWPDTVVEESSLRVHIAGLRKSLGEGEGGARFIGNVAGRGYCFVAPVRGVGPSHVADQERGSPPPLPPTLARIVGRSETIETVISALGVRRLVTIVGPGGMGKTTVAIEVGHRCLDQYPDGVWFADLSSIIDPDLIGEALVSILGLTTSGIAPTEALSAHFRTRRALLILDTCEHVVGSVTVLAERLSATCSSLHILATSRETLRAEGEMVYRLGPLQTPEDIDLPPDELLSFPAVELFVDHALAAGGALEFTPEEVRTICDICRKLDGLALALQLAAGRVEAYGVNGTASLLNNRLKPSLGGRRTALPRHKTLHALFDWSYQLLPDTERMVLRRLSVLVGPFTVEAAEAVVCDDAIDPDLAGEMLDSLVAKSLINPVVGREGVHYRLLDTTRAYAGSKLSEAEEAERAHRRLAEYSLERLSANGVGASMLGNLRAALTWSFSPSGDPDLGVRLAAAAETVFLDLSLLQEARRWAEVGLAAISPRSSGGREELELQEALAHTAMFTAGNQEMTLSAIARALQLAKQLGDVERQVALLSGLHIFHTRIGDFLGALTDAEESQAAAMASSDPTTHAMARWMLGTSYHLLGDQRRASEAVAGSLTQEPGPRPKGLVSFGFDHRIRSLIVHARCLWLRGSPDEALAVCQRTVEEADRYAHPVTTCIALIYTTTVYLWCGLWAPASANLTRLIAHADLHALGPYAAVGRGLQGELLIRTGEVERGLAQLQGALATLHEGRHEILTSTFLGAQAEGYLRRGDGEGALTVLDEALTLSRRSGSSFDLPELLRARGRAMLLTERPSRIEEADSCVSEAISEARRQDAVGWELRACVTLAEIRADAPNYAEAIRALRAVLYRITGGGRTLDIEAARQRLSM